ncbi:MAG: GNAT family N-acetyltransferase [Rhizomicrobium sp.]
MANLFDPFTLKDVTLKNRIVVAPMCQYSADDGRIGDWHLVHLGAHAIGGAGLIIAEATAVSPEGRITPGDTGIWSDDRGSQWERVVRFLKAQGAVPGIQIAHAGRKASANRPWEGDDHMKPDDPRAWEPIAPSADAFGGNLPRVPHAMTKDEIVRVRNDFAAAGPARRRRRLRLAGAAFRARLSGAELLLAHRQQAHRRIWRQLREPQPLPAGDLRRVREVWPANLPLTAKLGISDFVPQSQTVEESIELVRRLKALGLDLVDVSIGFNTPDMSGVPWGPAFMVPFAERFKKEAGIPVGVGWFIAEAKQADGIVRDGKADLIMLAHAMLDDPQWPYHAAKALEIKDYKWTLPRALRPLDTGVSMEVRMLEKGEAAVLARVAPAVFDNDIEPDLAREFLADPHHHIAVAIDQGVVVAFASGVDYIHPDKARELFVNEVGTAPTHRGRGLGRAVLGALLDRARAVGCKIAWVLTDTDNTPARGLYAALNGKELTLDTVHIEFDL